MRGWPLALGLLVLASLDGCSAAIGRVEGQQFISPRYAFELRLPGEAWQVVAGEASVLTLSHVHLAAGMTIEVTCQRDHIVPLDVLARHLFFGFRDWEVLQQEPRLQDGVPALKTVARAWLDGRQLLVSSYIMQYHDCVYDLVYFASPPDFPRGEGDFEQMMALFRFRN
jgi:hypothetical protein